jgi:DNA-binding FadR family transcriptional regulator
MPKHLSPDIARDIEARISAGDFPPGSVLPNERALAERYGVARNTVRNALDRIEKSGLITRHVGRGTMVKSRPSDNLLGLIGKISGAAPIDILNLRLIIEPQAAATAAITASAAELDAIEDADGATAGATSHEEFERWDNEFHSRIFRATRNEFLINLHLILSVVRFKPPMRELRRRAFSEANRKIYCEQHVEIMRALRHRDAHGAASAMRTHLATRKRSYFGE